MAKSSFKSIKISKPVKITTISKPKPTVPKTITPQSSNTVGKPVAKNATTEVKPKTENKTIQSKEVVSSTPVVEKQFITKEISRPQYIYSGSSNSFGDMLSNYIMLDWLFGNKNHTPVANNSQISATQNINNAKQNQIQTTETSQETSSSIVDNASDNIFSALTFLSIAIIVVAIPIAVYKYYKNKQEK